MKPTPTKIPLTNLIKEVLTECIEASGMKQKEIAAILDLTPSKFSDYIHGRRNLNVEMAYKLGILFKTSPIYWLNMQNDQQIREFKAKKGAEIESTIKPLELEYA